MAQLMPSQDTQILVLSYVLWTWHLSFDGKQSTRQKCLKKYKKTSMGILSQWTQKQSGMEIDFGEQIGSWSLQAK